MAHRPTRRTATAGLTGTLIVAFLAVACSHPDGQSRDSREPGPAQPTEPFAAETAEWPPTFGLGEPATAEEISAWDIDVRPDGAGLPPGSGTALEGTEIYALHCSSCHGASGTEGPDDRLVGRIPGGEFPFGRELGHRKTIGNYWPYATTIFDYVRRSMPYHAPGSLSADEVYALTAYLLHLNQIVPQDAIIDVDTLPAVRMPARDRFVPDDRAGGPELR